MQILPPTKRGATALFAACLLLGGAVLFAPNWWRDRYEDVAFTLRPTAARALAYGARHFSARDTEGYDLARAEYFYRAAATIDPNAPYVFHQLARIEFLRGNFDTALTDIDLQIAMHGDSEPNAYYVRGLIEGYMGRYDDAVRDYGHFLSFDASDWAAMNDYAWVLLKAKRATEALVVTTRGLVQFPDNPWLLNSNAIALYELGHYEAAHDVAARAAAAAAEVTAAQWLRAYPGNDPRDAAAGITALQSGSAENMHMIEATIASSTIQ